MDGKILSTENKDEGKNRTIKLNKQTFLSFIFQGISIVLSFFVVPLSISFLNIEQYGIWVTLLSMLSWFSIADLGIGFGLRNKLSESIAQNDFIAAKQYITTAYIVFASILFILLIVSIICINQLNWNIIFKTKLISNNELIISVSIVIIGLLIVFLFSLVNQLLNALHKSSYTVFNTILQNFLFILFLYFSTATEYKNSLIFVCAVYTFSGIFSILCVSFFIFYRFPRYKPNLRFYDKNKIKSLTQLGVRFFIIQIATMIIFSTDNIIILQTVGATDVTGYQLTRQIFGSVSLVANLVMSPLWSIYTEAYQKGDFLWIKRKIYQLLLLLIPLLFFIVVLSVYFDDIINLWVGKNVHITKSLVYLMGLYTFISIWNNIFAYFLNGISKTKEQLITALFAALLNIPLSIYFSKDLHLGSEGVILATILCLSLFAFVGPYSTFNLLKKHERR